MSSYTLIETVEGNLICNENGDYLVRDVNSSEQLWISGDQIHHIKQSVLEEIDGTGNGENIEELSVIESEEDTEVSNVSRFWSNEETLLLINVYKNLEKKFANNLKKQVWKDITAEINMISKKKFTSTNVENKFKSLKRTYKTIKLKNSSSGNQRKHWQYYTIMDDIFSSKPEINPPATASNSKGVISNLLVSNGPTASNSKVGDCPQPYYDKKENIENSNSGATAEAKNNFFKRKSGPSVNDRHKDKMARQDKFLTLFEKMIDKM